MVTWYALRAAFLHSSKAVSLQKGAPLLLELKLQKESAEEVDLEERGI